MIRAGLIGFGLGGRVFHAPLLSSVDGIELAAIVERTTNHAAERYPGITTYRTLDATCWPTPHSASSSSPRPTTATSSTRAKPSKRESMWSLTSPCALRLLISPS